MKEKILFALFLFSTQLCISQTQKLLSGVVKTDDFPLKGIEIINQTTQNVAVSDDYGRFSILATEKDKILFYGIDYYQKTISVNAQSFAEKFVVLLSKKPIEIDEVIVEKKENPWSSDYMSKIMDKQYVDDLQTSPKNTLVYDGQTMGVDFVKVGQLVSKLFKKKDKKTVEKNSTFTEFATNNFNQKFFAETLKIPEDEMFLFLEFCEADPKSAAIPTQNNNLATLDFLFAKNEEFKKIRDAKKP